MFKQQGATQEGALRGHEHFGFLDGVSQPGLRGLLSDDRTDVLTLRQNPDPEEHPNQGKPGQDLLWPGEFVFGPAYPKQDGTSAKISTPGPMSLPADNPTAPAWAENGSYLVFRRLRQDVGAFHNFLNDKFTEAGVSSPGALGARMVGRWASGAPVLRSETTDNAALGEDDCANNNFEFQAPSAALTATPGSLECDDNTFTPSHGDSAGALCPFNSHVRKSYPRDDIPTPDQPDPYNGQSTQDGAARRLNEPDTQTHRLLRCGIPYGPSSSSRPDAPLTDTADRGLLFFAYMTSISNQFEFVMGQWVNNTNFKRDGTGLDLILGQQADGNKTLNLTASASTASAPNWITTTGSGYMFAPSLDAIRDVLAAPATKPLQ